MKHMKAEVLNKRMLVLVVLVVGTMSRNQPRTHAHPGYPNAVCGIAGAAVRHAVLGYPII